MFYLTKSWNILFPFLCDINEKYLVFLHSKSFPEVTWAYSMAACPWFFFPRRYQIWAIVTHNVFGGVCCPRTFGRSPSVNTMLKWWSLCRSHCYSCATWILEQGKQGPGVKSVSALEIWKAATWSSLHISTQHSCLNIVLHKNSKFILAALQGPFSAWMPRSLFLSIVSGWCPGIKDTYHLKRQNCL